MESNNIEPSSGRFKNLKRITPLSKYLAMILFIIMPFIGGWIGYSFAPSKIVEIEVPAPALVASNSPPATSDIDKSIGFKNDSYDAIPQGGTSVVLLPNQALDLEITLFSPDDPEDSRLQIKNIETGKSCDTENYLISRLLVSSDQKKAYIYNYSGSTSYLDIVDTDTCTSAKDREVIKVE